MKLGFIGGGNMAAALIGGLSRKGFAADAIRVAETNAERRAWLASEFGVRVEESAAETLAADVVVLAVKPQQLSALLRGLPPLDPGQLVLSIAAGVRALDISRWLGGHAAVARAMPNTPASCYFRSTRHYTSLICFYSFCIYRCNNLLHSIPSPISCAR
jgi:pyrroline-5-carboxylate reductase